MSQDQPAYYTAYITERGFRATVIEMAEAHGWRVYCVLDTRVPARRTSKGFPDLLLLKDGVMYCWELKSEKGTATAEQLAWLEELAKVPGVRAAVVRPADIPMIEMALFNPAQECVNGAVANNETV